MTILTEANMSNMQAYLFSEFPSQSSSAAHLSQAVVYCVTERQCFVSSVLSAHKFKGTS